MQPPGRRRHASLSAFSICLALLLWATTAQAAVLGLDFGTLNIKAALVKPGIPLDIVLTKDSKRKEVAALAFKPNRDEKNNIIAKVGTFPERKYGSDALALQGRMSGEVFPNLKLLLGLQPGEEADATQAVYNRRYPEVKLQHVAELGTTMVKSSAFPDEIVPFSVEELIGMELANIRRNAEVMAGSDRVEDAVITIPSFYTADEKRAIVKAASFADLSVNALLTDGLAVGLDFAKARTFPNVSAGEKPEFHLVYDMGAGSTTATVMRFQSRSVKDVGRFNKTIQEVAVVGSGWDRTLGGDSLNHVVLDDYITKLLTKPVFKNRGTQRREITSNGRVMSRLYKEAERARQVLSANSETASSFEELLPDIDFRTKMSRADFEKLATKFIDRVEAPISDALAMAKLTMADIDSVILHGGAVRTPFVQKKLEEVAGGPAKLRSNVNPDESAVFGAAFKAAGLSPSFKVREVRDTDIAGYPSTLLYTDGDKERRNTLFHASSPVGAGAPTKQVTFKDKDDFTFSFVQTVESKDLPVLSVKTENVTASVQELIRKFGCEKDEISTKLSIRLHNAYGLPEIVAGSVSCEVDDSKTASVGDTVKDWFGFGKKKDQQPLGEDEDSEGATEEINASSSSEAESSSSTSALQSSASSAAAEVLKKHTETIPIQWTTRLEGNPQPAKEEVDKMVARLHDFDKSDRARVAREEAQNALESYAYFVRDLLTRSDYETVSTSAQRTEISELLETTREWMDSGSELATATKQVLKEKLDALKQLVQPVITRRDEDSARPAKLASLKSNLDDMGRMLLGLESQVQSAIAARSKASASASSSSTSETTESVATSATADDLADLEEPDTTSTSSSVRAPKPSDPAGTNPLANLDLTDVRETYESINKWLAEKEAAQKKLQPFDEPALLVKDLEAKAKELQVATQEILNKQLKAARSTPKKLKTSKTKPAKKTKSTATEAAEPSRSRSPGDESIDDILDWMDKAEEERPRDEL